MKTFAEQIAALKATRAEKHDRMKAIAQKSIDESRSMDTGEAEEFDTLKAEVKRLDDDIKRLSELGDDQATAKPVDDKAKREAPADADTKGAIRAPVQVKNTEKLAPGIGFARVARCKALAFLNHQSVEQIAKSIYPSDEVLHKAVVNKAAVSAASTMDATFAGNLVLDSGASFADFVEYLRPLTLLGQVSDRLRRLPFDTPVLIQGSGGAAKWVKEGNAKPLTEWTYTRTKLAPLKVAAIAAATKETLARASMAADTLLRDELARAVGARVDTTFIDPDAVAVTDEAPASILNGVAAITLSGGTTVADIRCDIATFLTAFADNNQSVSGAFWVMPERIAIALSLIVNEVGAPAFPGITPNGGTFAGLPVFVTGYADTDSNGSVVALVKGDEIFLGDEGGIQVSMSDQASLVMDNAPSMNSTTPTPAQVVSMWQTNSVAFLVERFINWQRRRPEAVAWARVNWDACQGS